VQDGTVKIHEPPIRNSGFVGGVFLARRSIKTNGEPLTHLHLYIGAKVDINDHKFMVLAANENTLRWMEDHHIPRASFYDIIDKIRPKLYDDAVSGNLSLLFQAKMDSNDMESKSINQETLSSVFEYYNLLGDGKDDISQHEVLSLVRMVGWDTEGNKTGHTLDYSKLIEQIVSPTDEYM
jgi:hypothetical protein